RLQGDDPRDAEAPRHSVSVFAGQRHGCERTTRALRALVRRARTCDLLPRRIAVVLPHTRMRREHARVCGCLRQHEHQRSLFDAGQAERRRLAAAVGNMAPLSPVQGQRQGARRSVHAAGSMKGRALTWSAACALVVLGARALAYQLAPRTTVVGLSLEEAVGGPRLVVIAVVSLVGALALAASVAWLAAVAVRERHLVAGGPLPDRVRPLRILSSALLLFAASSLAFDALESYLHWHAGLGFHGLHCLVGPVHRDALPLLAALSI